MFDKLEDLVHRYEDLMFELQSPDVANDTVRFRKLMKEQSDLSPIVEAYTAYKKAKQDIEDSLSMLESESDEEITYLDHCLLQILRPCWPPILSLFD